MKEVEKLLNDLQIVATAVRIAELHRNPKTSARGVSQIKDGEQSPRLRIMAAMSKVIAESGEDGSEGILAHGRPVEGLVYVRHFVRRCGQPIEEKSRDDTEVTATRTATRTEEIGIVVLIDATQFDAALAIDGENLNLRKPIDRKTMQP